jgi:hypothetical protein
VQGSSRHGAPSGADRRVSRAQAPGARLLTAVAFLWHACGIEPARQGGRTARSIARTCPRVDWHARADRGSDSYAALTSAALLGVQASGGISVHAPVRVHRIPPSLPIRARAGAQGQIPPLPVHHDALCAERWAEFRSGYGGGPSVRSRRQHGGLRSRLPKGRGPCRRHRQNAGLDREVR